MENKTEKSIKKITLEQLGMVMPIGIATPDGSYSKSFSMKRWRMKEERELGELRDQNRDSSVGQFVASVLSFMCTSIGTNDFDKMKSTEKIVHISQMYVGDVFYIYTWLRIKSLGSQLKLDIKCPNCSNKFKFTADLNTVEVDVCEKAEDAFWDYKLREPFEIRGRLVTELRMGPPKWITLENMKGIGGLNTGAAKAGMIIGSIINIVDWKDSNGKPMPVALAMAELDEMSKADIEKITSLMDKNAVGPNMSIEGECPRCRYNYNMAIDWSYDNFFGISSH